MHELCDSSCQVISLLCPSISPKFISENKFNNFNTDTVLSQKSIFYDFTIGL